MKLYVSMQGKDGKFKRIETVTTGELFFAWGAIITLLLTIVAY